jgi:hypothetical protein
MDPLYLVVTPCGKGYVAESRVPDITALGASPQVAAENARLAVIAHLAMDARPFALILRVNEPGLRTIVMQPIDECISLTPIAEKSEWRYMASVKSRDAGAEAAD